MTTPTLQTKAHRWCNSATAYQDWAQEDWAQEIFVEPILFNHHIFDSKTWCDFSIGFNVVVNIISDCSCVTRKLCVRDSQEIDHMVEDLCCEYMPGKLTVQISFVKQSTIWSWIPTFLSRMTKVFRSGWKFSIQTDTDTSTWRNSTNFIIASSSGLIWPFACHFACDEHMSASRASARTRD